MRIGKKSFWGEIKFFALIDIPGEIYQSIFYNFRILSIDTEIYLKKKTLTSELPRHSLLQRLITARPPISSIGAGSYALVSSQRRRCHRTVNTEWPVAEQVVLFLSGSAYDSRSSSALKRGTSRPHLFSAHPSHRPSAPDSS